MPNGATVLLRTLVEGGVTTCFTNPGTSEMHFVAALDDVPEMRAVLTLFEGVATGAADGYARMAEHPAATLLHLGPGLGNGIANLHNARKARTSVVNIVGEHATTHTHYDTPLQSDIETLARNVSTWVRTSAGTEHVGRDTAEAIAASVGPPGGVATLIVPADISWCDGAEPAAARVPAPSPATASEATIDAVAAALRGRAPAALLVGGRALREPTLSALSRIAAVTGARLYAEVFPARMHRGAGRPPLERLAYFAELAQVQLAGLHHLVLVDTTRPVSFFAYPGQRSDLVPDGCYVHELVDAAGDVTATIGALAEQLGAGRTAPGCAPAERPTRPNSERLTADTVCQIVSALLPEQAIISDEAQTSGLKLATYTHGAPPHDVLTLTGGAIGQGLPVAVGAAVACPQRPVIALQADGSAMYTVQALWTMAREGLDVTVILLNNASYSILNIELQRVGARAAGPAAAAQLDLSDPMLDFVALAHGLGVPARRVDTSSGLHRALAEALSEPGPHLIEAVIPSAFTGAKLKALPYAMRALTKLPHPIARAVKHRLAP